MTESSRALAAGIRTAHPGRHRVTRTLLNVVVALVAGATLSAMLFLISAPSGADQVSSLKAQAASLSSQMLLEQLQIGGYQQQYGAAVDRVTRDEQVMQRVRGSIAHDQHRIVHDTAELRSASVLAFENGGTDANVTPLFESQRNDGSRSEYQQILSGDVADSVDQLQSDRQALQVHESALQQIATQDQQSETDAHDLLQQSQNTQAQLAAQSSQVNGELAAAVAQQQAAAAAAAAAAVAAARARVNVTAAAPKEVVVGDPSTVSTGTTVAPALNSFLQCVLQAESGGDYQAVSPNGEYMGAFQFSQSTWNEAASLAGQPALIGVPPDQATPAQQDDLAIALYNADGSRPWYDPCTGR